MTKPFKSYLGGKEGNGTLQTIINHIPPHKTYIEGFLGNGAIIRNKKPSCINIGIDYDSGVIDKWNSFSSGENYRFIHANFLHLFPFLESTLDPKDVFIYLDPPYFIEKRASDTKYKVEFDLPEHIALLDYISSSKFKILISCYDNDIYKSKLSMWSTKSFQSMTRGGMATETIYWNYPLATLHQYNYLGSNFTERQRIKRKVQRAENKMKNLSPLERAAVIDKINSVGLGA